jgi:hypothetical protein
MVLPHDFIKWKLMLLVICQEDFLCLNFILYFSFQLKNRYELNNMKRKLDGIKQLRARLFK